MDNVISKMEEHLNDLEGELVSTREQLEIAKNEIEKPFEREEELRNKILRLNEINKILDMQENEESAVFKTLKEEIIKFRNNNYEESITSENFNSILTDYEHIKIAEVFVNGQEIIFEINVKDYVCNTYVDGNLAFIEKLKGGDEESKIKEMIEKLEQNELKDFMEEYFFLEEDSDNDGVRDKYDIDFMHSDVQEVGDLDKRVKPSTLDMIKKFKEEIKLKDSTQKNMEHELL